MLDKIEKLARYVADSNGLTTDFFDGTLAHGDRVKFARAVLIVLPVVRAAVRHESIRRGVVNGKATHREMLGASEDLENAVDTMRAALEQL